MKVAVHCEGVKKSYGSGAVAVQALRGVDLDILMGELFMLVGPSGSGKTTLISVIGGILRQDAGKCIVFGKDYKKMKPIERAAYRGSEVGFVFQAFNLIPALPIVENVGIPLLIQGKKRRDVLPRAMELLEEVGLGERAHALPGELSGGEQQRVAICRALVHQPKLVICDEPTSNLDHETGTHVMEIFHSIAHRPDRALVIVTHDSRIFNFADRIGYIDDGKIVNVEART